MGAVVGSQFSRDLQYRAALRAENLEKHQAPGGFNPITGEPRAAPRVPVRPAGVF
jgi:hypothetical protein